MDYEVEIYLLSEKFIKDYPANEYPELMFKQSRPYNCLLIDTHCDYFICIPYRSSITHKNAYMFRNSRRSQQTRSGLDFSKIVIIQNSEYIDASVKAVIDQDEYNETITNIDTIIKEAVSYVDVYISHIRGDIVLHQKEFERKYKFSSLQYFKEILLNTSC